MNSFFSNPSTHRGKDEPSTEITRRDATGTRDVTGTEVGGNLLNLGEAPQEERVDLDRESLELKPCVDSDRNPAVYCYEQQVIKVRDVEYAPKFHMSDVCDVKHLTDLNGMPFYQAVLDPTKNTIHHPITLEKIHRPEPRSKPLSFDVTLYSGKCLEDGNLDELFPLNNRLNPPRNEHTAPIDLQSLLMKHALAHNYPEAVVDGKSPCTHLIPYVINAKIETSNLPFALEVVLSSELAVAKPGKDIVKANMGTSKKYRIQWTSVTSYMARSSQISASDTGYKPLQVQDHNTWAETRLHDNTDKSELPDATFVPRHPVFYPGDLACRNIFIAPHDIMDAADFTRWMVRKPPMLRHLFEQITPTGSFVKFSKGLQNRQGMPFELEIWKYQVETDASKQNELMQIWISYMNIAYSMMQSYYDLNAKSKLVLRMGEVDDKGRTWLYFDKITLEALIGKMIKRFHPNLLILPLPKTHRNKTDMYSWPQVHLRPTLDLIACKQLCKDYVPKSLMCTIHFDIYYDIMQRDLGDHDQPVADFVEAYEAYCAKIEKQTKN